MRIAIADDHAVVRDGLTWMLSDHDDIDVVGEASDGPALIALLKREDVDVVLLDVSMPEMTGLEVLEEVARLGLETRVIMLTMHDQPVYVKRAIELGAAGYLLKSAGHDELVRALRAVHAGKAYIQGEVSGPLIQAVAGSSQDEVKLSPRELEVLMLVASGNGNKQIARALNLSETTVKSYLKSAFERLGVTSRAEAVAVAMRRGMIE